MSARFLATPRVLVGALGALALGSACGADQWSVETNNGVRVRVQTASAAPGPTRRPALAPAAGGRSGAAFGVAVDPSPDDARRPEVLEAGSGGPGGNFDWCIPAGQTVIFDTTSTLIVGGPNCTPTTIVQVQGGVVEVRDLRVGPGALLKVQGPNPFVLMATGSVTIEGTIDVSGTASLGVVTLGTTNIPEPGAPGQAGGGRGGTGSPLSTASSPKGGAGAGAFDVPGQGGGGGETGWNNVSASLINGRRGAGGGGGAFGPNQRQGYGSIASFGDWEQSYIGLDCEPGFANTEPGANGALVGAPGPLGGRCGPTPFGDGDPLNDFYGVALDTHTGQLVVGELKQPWAGAGGGAGGDASFVGIGGTFPATPFQPNGDEKGSGGAGGGGALHVMALGDITFGLNGLIKSRGGSGGGGENTIFLNRVGGGSGGGSGGHVLLETAGRIDFSQVTGPSTTPGVLGGGILATGGQGGAGKADAGGAILGPNGKIELQPQLDACPLTSLGTNYPTTGTNACQEPVDGAGGDGGPGLIQLHTRNGLDPMDPGILLPLGKSLEDLCKPSPVGLRQGLRLLPRFACGS